MLSRIKLYLSTDNRKRFHNAYILPHFGETAHITFFNSIQFKNFILRWWPSKFTTYLHWGRKHS